MDDKEQAWREMADEVKDLYLRLNGIIDNPRYNGLMSRLYFRHLKTAITNLEKFVTRCELEMYVKQGIADSQVWNFVCEDRNSQAK